MKKKTAENVADGSPWIMHIMTFGRTTPARNKTKIKNYIYVL